MTDHPATPVCSIAVSDGRASTRLQTGGDPFDPGRIHVATGYRPSGKNDKARYTTTGDGSLQPLPAGRHSIVATNQPPGYHAELWTELSSGGSAQIDILEELQDGDVPFEGAYLDLVRGAVTLTILNPRTPRPDFRLRLHFETAGAYAYDSATLDDGSGSGPKPLTEGDTHLIARQKATVALALGKCERITLNWKWL